MGRRKERRLAAMSAAGRRVKLDLFAEPSGGLGGQNEVGGDDNVSKNQLGLSNSPSSSGKQPENPLALLGQYSDDELDERSSGSSGEDNQAAVQNLTLTLDNPVQLSSALGSDDTAMKEVNGYTSQTGKQLEAESRPASMEFVQKMEESHPTEDCVASSDTQEAEGVVSGWKMVLHEESNQYYYWNVTTGETFWEMPDVLAQTTDSTRGKKDSAITEYMEIVNDGEVPNHSEREHLEGNKGSSITVQSHLNGSSSLIEEHNPAPSSPRSNVISREADDDGPSVRNATNVESLEFVHGQHYDGSKHLQSYLLKHYEHLLEQLNFAERTKCNLHRHDEMLRWELEMRLADNKSLAIYGSSLLPYWEYCKGRFAQLEEAVNDVVQCLKCKELNEVHVAHETSENACNNKVENLRNKKPVHALGDFDVSQSAGKMEVLNNGLQLCSGAATELVLSDKQPTSYCGNVTKEKSESDSVEKISEFTPQIAIHIEEDTDMDVDMEVEDIGSSSKSTAGVQPPDVLNHVSSDQVNQSNLYANHEPSAPVGEQIFSIPPAPDDDWIPPPPLDNEPIPPPPPDEPPENTSQLSDLAPVQSFPHPEQFSYSNPNFDYYGQANTELSSSSFFANAEVYQPTISHPPLYYEALAGSYGPATLAANPIVPSMYFGVQEGTLQASLESSGFRSESVHKNADAIGSLDEHAVGSASSLPKSEVNASTIVSKATEALPMIPHSEAPMQESATNLASESASISSVPAVTSTVAASATAVKGQSKVMRAKKRTIAAVSSLRSNKKVSSLVDKWKAAKEELEEVEKEPKNAYEILEMKRQREIEEWHAQQIASGEAKDNANFQPLGGDWRERVKRKRAQLANASGETPSGSEGKQQPDLNELSKGLPPGWQVYWDDSSKQAYYGNSVTLETTWIRPTK